MLLRGPSGAGKSDLLLRAMAAGFRLVADDRVRVWRSGDRAFGRAPDPLAGLMEVRELGVGPAPALAFAPVAAVVDLRPGERLPGPDAVEVAGVTLPRLDLDPFARSAPLKLAWALDVFGREPPLRPPGV